MANGNGGFDPNRLQDWTVVLHNAAKVRPGAPDYDEARATAGYALQMIGHLNRVQNQQDYAAGQQPGIAASPFASAFEGALHGASLGLGEPIAGVGSALTGGSFREGAAQYREGLGNLEAANPNLAAASETVGGLLPFAFPTAGAAAAIKPGVALSLPQVAAQLGKAGASRGGEDPGDLAARLQAAKHDAIVSGILSTALAGAGMTLTRAHVERAADLNAKGTTRALNEARLQLTQARIANEAARAARSAPVPAAPADLLPGGLSADAVRAKMGALNIPPDRIEATIAQLQTAGQPAPMPAPMPSMDAPAVPGVTAAKAAWAARYPNAAPLTDAEAMQDERIQAQRDAFVPDPNARVTYLHGRTPTGAPAPLMPAPAIGQPAIPGRPELGTLVPAGLFQRSGSALRTESPPANLVMQAIKLSGQAPELLQVEGASGYAIPTEQLRTQLALLDMLAPGTQKPARAAITAELARRAAKGNP